MILDHKRGLSCFWGSMGIFTQEMHDELLEAIWYLRGMVSSQRDPLDQI